MHGLYILKHGVIFEGKTAAQWLEEAKKLPEIELTQKPKTKLQIC